jgi:osmotically-inducible protein OsmY
VRIPLAALAVVALLQTGCTTAIIVTYQTLSEVRTVREQHEDTRILGTIKDELAAKDGVGSALQIHVFSFLGHVLLAGVVEPGSTLGTDAVAIARKVDGVQKVDTFFIRARPSYSRDLTVSLKLQAKIVADLELRRSQIDWTVLAGTVLLVGLVDSQEKAKKIVEHAKGTDYVVAVRSFIQVRPPGTKPAPFYRSMSSSPIGLRAVMLNRPS